MPGIFRLLLASLLLAGLFLPVQAQEKAPAASVVPANFRLSVARSPLPVETLLDPAAPAWQQFAVERVALNRTPPLYDTDPPANPEIPLVEVRVARSAGKLLVHLAWQDATEDAATLAAAPTTPPEQRVRKEGSAATERFFDAAAVMFPTRGRRGDLSPSLQMGDPQQPVTIYYWNAARGAMLMEAQGRGSTRRTAQNFPARGIYRAGTWRVTLALPELPAGNPLAIAVWNGSQKDRDGRKYFSVWHWLE